MNKNDDSEIKNKQTNKQTKTESVREERKEECEEGWRKQEPAHPFHPLFCQMFDHSDSRPLTPLSTNFKPMSFLWMSIGMRSCCLFQKLGFVIAFPMAVSPLMALVRHFLAMETVMWETRRGEVVCACTLTRRGVWETTSPRGNIWTRAMLTCYLCHSAPVTFPVSSGRCLSLLCTFHSGPIKRGLHSRWWTPCENCNCCQLTPLTSSLETFNNTDLHFVYYLLNNTSPLRDENIKPLTWNISEAFQSFTLIPIGNSDHNAVHLIGNSDHNTAHLVAAYRPRVQTEKVDKKHVRVWSPECVSELHGCFDCTDWDVLIGASESVN